MGDPLHAIADSQDWHARGQNLWIALRGLGVIDGTGAAAKDYAGWLELHDFFERRAAWQDGGEDLLFADSTSDQLSVLAAEVQDVYAVAFGVRSGVLWLHGGRGGHCNLLGE